MSEATVKVKAAFEVLSMSLAYATNQMDKFTGAWNKKENN